MLEQPARQGMLGGDLLSKAVLEAQLQRTKLSSDVPHSDLRAPIGLAVVFHACFVADAFEAWNLPLDLGQCLFHQSQNVLPIVGLNEKFGVPKPRDI